MTQAERTAPRRPWDRQDSETPAQYAAFAKFKRLGPRRKLLDLGEYPPKIRNWSSEHKWFARAQAWDSHVEKLREKGIERATMQTARNEAFRIARAREQANQEASVASQQLKIKAFQMLQWELSVVTKESSTTSEDGRVTIIHQTIEPARWSLRDAAAMLKLSREIDISVLWPERDESRRGPVDHPDNSEPIARPEDMDRAERVLAEWRERMKQNMLRMPDAPPGSLNADAASGLTLSETHGFDHQDGNDGTAGHGTVGHGNGFNLDVEGPPGVRFNRPPPFNPRNAEF